MDDRERERLSKFLSYVLRHRPQTLELRLDAAGWTDVTDLLSRCRDAGYPMTPSDLQVLVRSSDKQRFSLSADGSRIRANQGHSVAVDLGYEDCPPPKHLFHGTVERFAALIRVEGLRRMQRHHVHLSADLAPAIEVSRRRGEPVVFRIDADTMAAADHVFFRSENGVWLTESVPPEFLYELPAAALQ